jgi:class 3 adenylate cyclase
MEAVAKETGRLLESFLPLELLARLHGPRGELPAAVEFTAAVLFVDVSRYTAVVERLARRGQEGLEKISELLSVSYGRCADQICDRGGEVLYFEGDSLVAYWTANDSLPDAVRAASACAKAICGDHHVGLRVSEAEPTLHVGVGVGKLWAAAIGGQPVWNLIVGGDALMQAATAQMLAGPREYALSDEAVQALAAATTFPREPVETDAAHRAAIPSFDWLFSFLPPPLHIAAFPPIDVLATADSKSAIDVRTRETDNLFRNVNEIRPVSVIFARISGLDPRAPPVLSQLHKLCVSLQDDVRARGGPLGELYFDEKGLIFSCVFGARGSFHRDDPYRAIDAARAMDKTAKRLGLSASIGVATGHALFCIVGSGRRRQLMVHGAAMNRAARLMTMIAADIVCDAPTERANRTAFFFEQQGTLQLDGLGDVTAVFRPLAPRVAIATPSALIGREAELAVLKQLFEETRGGGTRLLAILGEPGIGKTALVTAFTEELQQDGMAVVVARAEREDRRTSLLPWRRVLASLVGLPSDCNGFAVLEQIRVHVDDKSTLVERLPLLGDVLGVGIPENDATRHLEGPHRADATMRLLGDIVDAMAPQPLVLILEDSQWLDSASWRLIEWILKSVTSLLLIACVRLEEIPGELKILRRRAEAARMSFNRLDVDDPARFCQILDLDELGDVAIGELVARTLGQVPPHQELAGRIAALAGGNPFFAEEISIALKSEGLVAVRDGMWRSIRPLDKLRYFEGVERVIRERVDLLDAKPFEVLKVAAIIGRSFRVTELKILLEELKDREVENAIESLSAVHFVRQGSSPDEYEFRHDQIRDVVYSLISVDDRRRLHGLLADWTESNQSPTAPTELSTLVQHFEAAGNTKKAVKYADLAATRALQVGAFREVEAFLSICFGHEARQHAHVAEQRLQAVRWRRQLAEAHYGRGDIHAQGVAVRRALNVAGYPVPRLATTTVIRLVARALQLALQQVFVPSATSNHIDRRPWEREIARCLNQAATVDYFELRYARGMCNLIGAVVHAERLGPSVELAVASSQLGCGLSFLGWQSACDYFISRAERVAIALADPAVHSHVYILDALWRVGRCDWAMVDRRLNESQELSTKAGDQLAWCNAQGIRFWSLYYRGDRTALEQTALALLSRAQNAGNIQQELWALRCKALCVLHVDRPREAVDILRLITSAMLGSVDLAAQISAKGALALALARIGQDAESIEAVTDTLQLLRELRRPTSHSTLVGISGVTEVLLRGREAGLSREYDQWSDWERQALDELKCYSQVFPLGQAQFRLWKGTAHWLDGQRKQALVAWNEALAIAQRLSLRQDESMIAAEMRRRQVQG